METRLPALLLTFNGHVTVPAASAPDVRGPEPLRSRRPSAQHRRQVSFAVHGEQLIHARRQTVAGPVIIRFCPCSMVLIRVIARHGIPHAGPADWRR